MCEKNMIAVYCSQREQKSVDENTEEQSTSIEQMPIIQQRIRMQVFHPLPQQRTTGNSYSASRDKWGTVGGDGRCRVGEVRAGTTSPMPDHKGFKS